MKPLEPVVMKPTTQTKTVTVKQPTQPIVMRPESVIVKPTDPVIVKPPGPVVVKPTTQTVTTAKPVITQTVTTSKPVITQTVTTAKPVITQTVTTAKPVITQTVTTAKPVITQTVTTAKPVITQTVTTAKPVITQTVTTSKPVITQTVTTAKPVITQTVTTAKPIISQTVTTAKPVITQTVTTAKPVITQTVTTAKPVITQTVTTAKPVITQTVTTAKPVITQTVTTAKPITTQTVISVPTITQQTKAQYSKSEYVLIRDYLDKVFEEDYDKLDEEAKKHFDIVERSVEEYRRGEEITDIAVDNINVTPLQKYKALPSRIAKRLTLFESTANTTTNQRPTAPKKPKTDNIDKYAMHENIFAYLAAINTEVQDEADERLSYNHAMSMISIGQWHRGEEITDRDIDAYEVEILDEYKQLPPRVAKRLTLTVNRLNELRYARTLLQGDQPKTKRSHNEGGIIRPGYYPNIQKLIDHINALMESGALKRDCSIKYNESAHRVNIIPALDKHGNYYYPDLGSEVEAILGLTDYNGKTLFEYIEEKNVSKEIFHMVEQLIKGEKWRALRPVELNAGFHTLYLYTDIIQETFVGDSYAKLLRQIEIPQDSVWGEQIVIKYDKPHYLPLCSNIFETIEIDFKNELGQTLPFEFGRTIVKLHFVRYE